MRLRAMPIYIAMYSLQVFWATQQTPILVGFWTVWTHAPCTLVRLLGGYRQLSNFVRRYSSLTKAALRKVLSSSASGLGIPLPRLASLVRPRKGEIAEADRALIRQVSWC